MCTQASACTFVSETLIRTDNFLLWGEKNLFSRVGKVNFPDLSPDLGKSLTETEGSSLAATYLNESAFSGESCRSSTSPALLEDDIYLGLVDCLSFSIPF